MAGNNYAWSQTAASNANALYSILIAWALAIYTYVL